MTEFERKLLYNLMTKKISPVEFIKSFTVDISKNHDYINQLLEEAYNEKQPDDVEYLLTAMFYFELFTENFSGILCKLVKERWHFQHENIAMIFQKMKSSSTVNCLYETAQTQFEYLAFDEAFALAVKCIWALGNINTPESREKLELLTKSDNEIIRENAIKQLNRVI